MSDSEMLLTAILREPSDDLARLAFADRCEEAGDADRAAFIRLQLAMEERVNCCEGVPGDDLWRCGPCQMLRRRAAELLAHAPLWWLPLPAVMSSYTPRIHFNPFGFVKGDNIFAYRRGFCNEVRCRLGNWHKAGEAIVKSHPVETLKLSDCPVQLEWGHRIYRTSVSAEVWHELGGYSADTYVEWDSKEKAELVYCAAVLVATKKAAGIIYE